ncbi:hypothetical protein KEU06_24540 [Pseudaminobacter sp. 19-2017]|uniref:Uncharacterized protein n=1 Tax=Pseudaminobacter soli (ex Zhang et al. 2022) TaxID=2831468 RepID=A0A942E2J8_9HYPH|nr:hypothetical protein [Pseudaminobacter soli]MBS3651787.1 hypothetical protein [Pseudaminobacter soli]
MTLVKDAASLQRAIHQNAARIEVQSQITDLSSLKLPAGTHLRGVSTSAELHFKEGQPGLMLSADHQIADLRLVADETQVALGLSDDEEDLGTLTISNVRTVGRVHLEGSLARRGDLKLENIHVERADARLAAHRPGGFGVEVLLGGLTVYNYSKDKASRWTLEALNLSGGSRKHPLRGSGVFIFGGWFIPVDADLSRAPAPTQEGGTIELKLLKTGEVHADGGIPKGTSNLIAGGVFVGSGVHAQSVVNEGPTTTYGPNDMVLDNWGRIDSWVARAAVTSHGSSGIGFVNFGDIHTLRIQAQIETHGIGARGFNLYDGSLGEAEFQSILTYGDGAIGVQLSKPFGTITVEQDIRTKGGEGDSLVRGKVVHLKAHALSLKPGAKGNELRVKGQIIAENSAVPDYDFVAPASVIDRIEVGGKPIA